MVYLTQNHPHITLRLKFKKVGNLQYISHLDLVRTMHKVIVRAGLPLWYTEGFNPKPKMTFAAPLSIGTESIVEFVDIKVIDDMPTDEVIRRLNANMADEMQVLDAYYTEDKLTELAWLAYRFEITTADLDQALANKCREALSAEKIEIEKKKTKKDEIPKLLDIKPLIKSFKVELNCGRLIVDAVLSAEPSHFLNPEYVIKALRQYAGILSSGDLLKEYYSIIRYAAYKDDMSEFR